MMSHQQKIIRSQAGRCVSSLGAAFAFLAISTGGITASPLDDQIVAFKDAPTQTEGAVTQILQSGIKEYRSAKGFAAVRTWLGANPTSSQQLLFKAGQAAEYAGEWKDAAGFYRKLLKNPKVDSGLAAQAAPAVYRIMINSLGDSEAAYLFMREDGARLRGYGRTRQYDAWFLERAQTRADFSAMANRLAAVYNSNDPFEPYAGYLDALLRELETFNHDGESLFQSLDSLAAAKRTTPQTKARIAWVQKIVPLAATMAAKVGAKEKIHDHLLDDAMKAADALVRALPYEGSIAVAKGWMHFNAGDSGVFSTFVMPRREEKVAPLLKALRSLPADQARDILATKFKGAKGRMPAGYLFSQQDLRVLVPQIPAVFNTLTAPEVPLFDKTITPDEAKTMAPHLARNPHAQAAMVRAWAKPERKYSAVTDDLMKSGMWRFSDIKALTHGLWHSGMFERDVAHDVPIKKYEKLDARYQQLKKQVDAKASRKDRLAAFKSLQGDLLSASPKITGALPLWGELLKQAPNADKALMLQKLTADFVAAPSASRALKRHLLRQALTTIDFGNAYSKLSFGPGLAGGWDRWGYGNVRKALPEFADYLETLLRQQMQAGRLSKPVFSMWLHCVDPKKKESAAFMNELVQSPAYAKMDAAYHSLASHVLLFGEAALTAKAATDPRVLSRELLALPKEATPAQVEAAFKTVMDRATKAHAATTVIGLSQVATLPEWSAATRSLVISLFKENGAIGVCPTGQGYEALVVRIAKEAQESQQWGALEPYAGGLWHAASATDDKRYYRAAESLTQFGEAALKDGASSLAMTVARSGSRSAIGRAFSASTEQRLIRISGRLRQVTGKAASEVGAVEIPVDESDPAYPIYKSNAEFVLGNFDSAWTLYQEGADQLQAVLRQTSAEYGFWLLKRNTETENTDRAEQLVKELTIWSRQAEGTFSLEQDAELKISYADLAFLKGALPTSRAWYRKVADAQEYQGSNMGMRAALGSVKVDRASRNFGAAMTELDKLMRLKNLGSRIKVHYARAEVFMDQENYKEGLDEIESVLRREPKHPDALILRGQIHNHMRKLVEASEIELGPSQENTVIVPGEAVKINLRDPTLRVSGVGADIEVEIWAKSGDKERVMLRQLGDNKEKFRAEVPTALGPPVPGDKILQILGEDEIRFGYSKRFRAKMDDLPDDPKVVIGVASDAQLALAAGAFPPREGERRLDIEELGLSTAQAALGTRSVRPGNPVYLRVNDPDQSKTSAIDEIYLTLTTSSGDEIRRLKLTETGPFTGEFQTIVPTSGAQALAFASESAPGRDPNMALSAKDYPGWSGKIGDRDSMRTFGIDLNDNVPLDKMSLTSGGPGQALTHFVLQTSMNGKEWTTRARYPVTEDAATWDGRPQLSSFPTYRGGMAVSEPEGRELPEDWTEIMELTSARASINYLSATVTGLSAEKLPVVNTGHPGYSGLIRYRALFYQPAAAIRRFQITGYPQVTKPKDKEIKTPTIFLIDGQPAGEDSEDPLTIAREFAPGLHEIQIWRHEGRDSFLKRKPVLLCDEPGQEKLVPCPDAMFDLATFPEGVRATIQQPAAITQSDLGFDIAFGDRTQARLTRFVIAGFEGVAPVIKKVTLSDRGGKALLPVNQDYKALRANTELEVLPGDQIVARYEDPVTATPKRSKHEQRLTVAFNNAEISASFLNYETTTEGRVLVLEPIRRFRFDDAVAIVINDPDMDGSPRRDAIEFKITTSSGGEATVKALETEEHSGRFIGKIFPVEGEPSRASEIKMVKGGTLTAVYRDQENLSPGIPTDRKVTISHANYEIPSLAAYNLASKKLPPAEPEEELASQPKTRKGSRLAPEIVPERRTLDYRYIGEEKLSETDLQGVVGASLRFDVVVPHLALAESSEIRAYIQTDAARKAAKADSKSSFNVSVPGTMKLTGALEGSEIVSPSGYQVGSNPRSPSHQPPLEEGRFSFSIPLILGDPPTISFANKAAESLPGSAIPDGLVVGAGDIVHLGYPYRDADGQVMWKTATFKVSSHGFLDVMDGNYNTALNRAFVGEKVYLRVLDRGLDLGPGRDSAAVTLKSTSGATTEYELRETEPHSGVFKGVFALSYADNELPAELPPVALNGFPVRYGDDVSISYSTAEGIQSYQVIVNKGADGTIEPFSKRFTGDEMAVQTSFVLAESFFELAKKHREMEQESLARREMAHAQKLLAEAIATHRDEELQAHAEYLLGNLSQEYADLSKNEEAKLPMYQDALARFMKITTDYPDTEFAPKAQFKTALVYEKMGEIDNAVEEYVKLAYKYPDDELIPEVMSRLGGYFQKKGLELKKQADPLRENEDDQSKSEVFRLDKLSYPQFLNAAMVFTKLQARFPDDKLAGLAGLRAAQNFMRAHQYVKAIEGFEGVYQNEKYDGRAIRSQAMYWCGLSNERSAGIMSDGNYKGRGKAMNDAYRLYRRVTFDFADSKWAKYARGRLADPAFERIIQVEKEARERMIETLKESTK
jgi:tetratricopeptide (TPR) repeat protein